MLLFRAVTVHVAIILLSVLSSLAAGAPAITLSVDASAASRKLIHAQLKIPASPGTLTLFYPKWIPGEHGPTGPVQDLTGLKFTASGKPLKWRRDLLDGWTFHVEVPVGESEVTADLDYASPAALQGGYGSGSAATEKLYVVNWNPLVLYPAGWTSDDLTYNASLKLPPGWTFGSSLPVASQSGSDVHFAPISLTMLIDGPVITGEYLKVVPLSTDSTPAEIDVAADTPGALAAPYLIDRVPTGRLTLTVAWMCVLPLVPLLWWVTPLSAVVAVFALLLINPAGNAGISSYRVAVTPGELQGRVSATSRFLAMSVMPLSPVLGGLLLTTYGAGSAVIALIAGTTAAALLITSSRSVRRVPRPRDWKGSEELLAV